MNQTVKDHARQLLFMQRLIWFAFSMNLIVLGVVLHLIPRKELGAESAAVFTRLVELAPLLVAGLFLIAYFVRRRFASASYARGMNRDKGAEEISEDLIDLLNPAQRQVLRRSGRIFVPLIVTLACNEAIGVIGFLIAYGGGSSGEFVPYLTVSLVLYVLAFPRASFVDDYTRHCG